MNTDGINNHLSKTNIYVGNLPGKLNNLGKYLNTLSENLPDDYFDSKELGANQSTLSMIR